MYKILLPILLLSAAAEAQITFTRADYYQTQDTTVTYGSNNKNVSPGNAGPNQTWDFSSVNLVSSAFSTSYVPNANTPGFSDFPNASIVSTGITLGENGQLISDSLYSFSLVTNTTVDLLGTHRGTKNDFLYKLKYTKPQRVLVFPFTYQDAFSYDAESIQEINGSTTSSRKQVNGNLSYDAYGKIVFPGTSTPVDGARFKKTEVTKDSMVIAQGPFSSKTLTTVEFTQYSFVTKDKKSLTILYTKSTITMSIEGDLPFPLPPTTQVKQDTSVFYGKPASKKEIVSSLENNFENEGVYRVFPSVTNGKITLSDPTKVTEVSIYSINGELQTKTTDFNNIELNSLPGIYIVKVGYINGHQKTYKIIKQ